MSLIEPGTFYTETMKRAEVGTSVQYSHPAYTSPTIPSYMVRNHFIGSGVRMGADPAKGVQRIYDLSLLPNPPLRFVLGKDAIKVVKDEMKSIGEDVAKYESWSEGLDFDS